MNDSLITHLVNDEMDLTFGDTNDSNSHRGNNLSMTISIKENRSIINNLPQRKHQALMVSLVILLNIGGGSKIDSLCLL